MSAQAQSGAAMQQEGAFRRDLTIMPQVTFSYESNALGGRLNTGNVRGRDDWRVSPSLVLGLDMPVGARQMLSLDAYIGYDFYNRFDVLNRERINATARLSFQQIASCRGDVYAGYGRRQSDVGDLFVNPALGLNRLKNTETETRFGTTLSCGSIVGLRPGMSYEHRIVTNSGERAFQDITSDMIQLSIGYERPAFGTMSLYGSYRDGRYPNRRDAPLALGLVTGIKVYSGGVSYNRMVGTRGGINGSVGYSIVKPDSNLVPDNKGLSYSVGLDYRPTDRITTKFNFSRSAEQSNLLQISYSIDTLYSAQVTYIANERLSFPASVSYRKRNFKQQVGMPNLFQSDDRNFIASLGAKYSFWRKATLGLNGSYRKRSSGGNLVDFTNKTVSLTLGYSF